jgi:hypothetical protein
MASRISTSFVSGGDFGFFFEFAAIIPEPGPGGVSGGSVCGFPRRSFRLSGSSNLTLGRDL